MTEFKIGPNKINPINAIDDVAAFNNKTDGGLELFTKAACKTGEFELNIKVMKPIIVSPNLYSSLLVNDDDDDDDDDFAVCVVVTSLNGFIISVVDVTSAVVKVDRLVLGGVMFDLVVFVEEDDDVLPITCKPVDDDDDDDDILLYCRPLGDIVCRELGFLDEGINGEKAYALCTTRQATID